MQALLLRAVMVAVQPVGTSADRHRGVFEALLWFGGLVLVVILAAALLLLLWRRIRRNAEKAPATGFSLDQLRAMQERGELSEAEYKRLRQSLIEQINVGADDDRR